MNNLISGIFGPRLNKYIVIGLILLVLGFFLIPILIGIPLMMIGSLFIAIGTFIIVTKFLPNGDLILSSYKKMYLQMWAFLKALIKDST